jgi:thymidylate synthase ThyX
MFNWRSFNHFLDLRMKPDAQREVRELSEQMLQLVCDIPGNPFKHTLDAFSLEPLQHDAQLEFYEPPY